jgi:hypothetical protein
MTRVLLISTSVLVFAACSSSGSGSTTIAGGTNAGGTTAGTTTTGGATGGCFQFGYNCYGGGGAYPNCCPGLICNGSNQCVAPMATSAGETAAGSATGSATTGGATGGCASDLCGGTCCTLTETCIGGSCCANAQVCGSLCCLPVRVCVKDDGGNAVCAQQCHGLAGDCMADAPCCALSYLEDGGVRSLGGCVPLSTANQNTCRCYTPGDCNSISSTDSCAPAFDSQGVITGPYLCTPVGSSTAPGQGCSIVGTVCNTNLYCARDVYSNDFCSPSCTSDSDCGNPGVACCNSFCDAGTLLCCGLCGS